MILQSQFVRVRPSGIVYVQKEPCPIRIIIRRVSGDDAPWTWKTRARASANVRLSSSDRKQRKQRCFYTTCKTAKKRMMMKKNKKKKKMEKNRRHTRWWERRRWVRRADRKRKKNKKFKKRRKKKTAPISYVQTYKYLNRKSHPVKNVRCHCLVAVIGRRVHGDDDCVYAVTQFYGLQLSWPRARCPPAAAVRENRTSLPGRRRGALHRHDGV